MLAQWQNRFLEERAGIEIPILEITIVSFNRTQML